MLRSPALKFLFLAVLLLGVSSQAAAMTTMTCTGKHLYIEVEMPDHTWSCYEIVGGCNGEWSYSWRIASPTPQPTHSTRDLNKNDLNKNSAATARTAQADGPNEKVVHILGPLKPSNVKDLFHVSDAMLQRYHKQMRGWPQTTNLGDLPGGDIPKWVTELSVTGTVPLSARAAGAAAVCSPPLYPNPLPGGGTACYPCLGCHPCGDSYCGNVYALTGADISPIMASQGYAVIDGKIQKPDATKKELKASPKSQQ
jgi:hypothetical protein